jgi:hypothetical protein
MHYLRRVYVCSVIHCDVCSMVDSKERNEKKDNQAKQVNHIYIGIFDGISIIVVKSNYLCFFTSYDYWLRMTNRNQPGNKSV